MQLIFASIFVFCVVFAIISDVVSLRIPNIIPIILAVSFAIYAMLGGVNAFWMHLLIAGTVFAILFGFFALGWIGAGDVKFLGALLLWVGPSLGAYFLLLFAIFSGVFALILLCLRYALKYYPVLGYLPVIRKISRWARNGIYPYGIPIGLAALFVLPSIFAGH